GERLYDKLESLDLAKTELLLKENYYQYLITYIQNDKSLDQVIMPSSVGISDGILSGFLTKMVNLQFELQAYLSRHKESENPLIRDKLKELDQVKASIVELVKNQQATD